MRSSPGTARWRSTWTPDASAIIVDIAHVRGEDTDWAYSESAHYDLGQAVAHMTLQALSIGFDAHRFRAFDRDAIAADFAVPPHWEVTSMTAFGVAAHPAGTLPGTDRTRRGRDEVTWAREGR